MLVIRPGLDLSLGLLQVSGYSLPAEPNSMPNSDAFVVSAAAAFRSRAGTCLLSLPPLSLSLSFSLWRICVSAIAARYLRTQQQQHNPGFQENINDNSKKKKNTLPHTQKQKQIGMHKSNGWHNNSERALLLILGKPCTLSCAFAFAP